MKRVFGSHDQVCHVWANQNQSEGRANNIFFRDERIYSYGTHFLAAQIHAVKGKRFALVNSRNYSSSTAKHLSIIRSSLRGLMPYYPSPDPSSIREAVKHADASIEAELAYQMKRVKITDIDTINGVLLGIEEKNNRRNELRAYCKLKSKQVSEKQTDALEEHFAKRLARWNELEASPKRVAEREARVQAEAERRAKNARESAEALVNFRAGKPYAYIDSDFDFLRIKGEELETSRGAKVPIEAAKSVFTQIKEAWEYGGMQCLSKLAGLRVGYFSFDTADMIGEELQLTFGCHRIPMSEAQAVLA